MTANESAGAVAGPAERKDLRVLIAVQPPSFQRIIEYVLHGHPGLRLVGGAPERNSPVDKAARLAPDVIIASTRLHGREPGDIVAALKRSSPASTLILLTHELDLPGPHKGADAWLPEDSVVRQLLPVIRKLADRVKNRAPQPAPAGRRD
jgi:DNA-binding NarL/FixJ family response regulator